MAELAAKVGPGTKLSRQELGRLLASYNQATERLKDSHDRLEEQVRRLGEELANKNRQLEHRKRLAALGQMAAGLAHEIRNPLGGIGLYADLLRGDLQDRPELVAVVDKIVAGVQSLDKLVNDVLSLAQTRCLQVEPVDIRGIIRSAAELVQGQLRQWSVQLRIDLPGAPRQLYADQNMLSRAVLNLLLNAIEACGPGGRVSLRVIDRTDSLRIEVCDSGPGVPKEIMDKIFNPFFTTKDCGTGLGLSMVHRIAEAHEGTVRVENLDQGGACFVLSLPHRPSRGGGQMDQVDHKGVESISICRPG